MAWQRLWNLARTSAGLPGYLRHPITTAQARTLVRERVSARDTRFLQCARAQIYDNPSSPYLRLLRWAGVTVGDLDSDVRANGLDATLARLRAAGVYVTLRELRGLDPILRKGLTIHTAASDFANPRVSGGIGGRSSGTRSAGTAVVYAWTFLAEEATTEHLLFAQHGLTQASLAMWLPVLPGIAGLHNQLLHLKAAPSVAAWFSQAQTPGWRTAPVNRAAHAYVERCAQLFGRPRTTPVHAPVGDAARVAAWMAKEAASRRPVALKAYASSAVRVAEAAVAAGQDTRHQIIFTGGEQLTARRRRFIESAGFAVHPRYATTESGMVGGACGRALGDAPDAMHVYLDRLAIVPGQDTVTHDGYDLRSLAFTSLTMEAPRVLLNADLGDWGIVERHPCDCEFGRAGMDLHVARLTSPDKLTGEGMTLLSTEMDQIVGALVEQHGGSPEHYQFRERHDDRGLSTLTIVISPAVRGIQERVFAARVLEQLAARPGGAALAARLWADSGAIHVVRDTPQVTAGHKMLPFVPRPDA